MTNLHQLGALEGKKDSPIISPLRLNVSSIAVSESVSGRLAQLTHSHAETDAQGIGTPPSQIGATTAAPDPLRVTFLSPALFPFSCKPFHSVRSTTACCGKHRETLSSHHSPLTRRLKLHFRLTAPPTRLTRPRNSSSAKALIIRTSATPSSA